MNKPSISEHPDEGIVVSAWIQMGCERREVTFPVTKAELETLNDKSGGVAGNLESYIEEAVWDWIQCRYGWGWTTSMFNNDFSFMEDGESAFLCVTNELLNPRTVYKLVPRAIDRWREASDGLEPD